MKAFAAEMGVSITAEGDTDAPEAVVESTETDQDGAMLYHDGPLAQGVAVFYDEELTEAAEDGEFGLADGRSIVVAEGVVESITESTDEDDTDAPANTAAITAAITAALAPITAQLNDVRAQVDKFNKVVPPTPSPRASGRTQTDAKGGVKGNKPHPMDNAKSK